MYEYGSLGGYDYGNGTSWRFSYKGDVRVFDDITNALDCLNILGYEGWKISLQKNSGSLETYIMIRDIS